MYRHAHLKNEVAIRTGPYGILEILFVRQSAHVRLTFIVFKHLRKLSRDSSSRVGKDVSSPRVLKHV